MLFGHSFVDESRITGESMPVEKTAGTHVFAGSINQSGALEVSAERIGRDTSYGKIIEAVERAERSRAPVQRLSDRMAGYLVHFAPGAAALTFLITRDMRATISVVIVAGACGETLGRVDTVVLDKTGTLTLGKPEVQRIIPAAETMAEEILAAAASAELRSEHPLGRSVVGYARKKKHVIAEPANFVYTPGRGITVEVERRAILVGSQLWMADNGIDAQASTAHEAEAGAEVFVARDGRLLGSIIVADTIRPEAQRAIAALHGIGVRTVLLTGDTRRVAAAVGAKLGIEEIEAELLPEQKLSRVRELVAQKCVVAMVGDGINDAPALAEANVGIAMGSGTDVAQESANVVLLGNDLARLVETLVLAKRTRGIIWQNFAGTLIVDMIGMGLAAIGVLGPLLAAFIHVSSELVFILNSARLLPGKAANG